MPHTARPTPCPVDHWPRSSRPADRRQRCRRGPSTPGTRAGLRLAGRPLGSRSPSTMIHGTRPTRRSIPNPSACLLDREGVGGCRWPLVTADLDTLLTALYVFVDDQVVPPER